MKEKIENFLYFLTIWFSISVIVLGIIGLIFTNINKSEKKIYIIHASPSYDSVGNVTFSSKIIDHEPTHQDSVEIGFIFK